MKSLSHHNYQTTDLCNLFLELMLKVRVERVCKDIHIGMYLCKYKVHSWECRQHNMVKEI